MTGAASYVLWGLLHLGLAFSMIGSAITDGLPGGELEAESLMYFVCAAVFGAQAIAVAWFLNRRNDRFGYWLNLIALGVIDAVFVSVMVVPGHVDPVGGLSGPLVWVIAALTSTMAIRVEPRRRDVTT
ncbi:hypothetical protein GCM10027447_25840 [Glycomyces halotolerans]